MSRFHFTALAMPALAASALGAAWMAPQMTAPVVPVTPVAPAPPQSVEVTVDCGATEREELHFDVPVAPELEVELSCPETVPEYGVTRVILDQRSIDDLFADVESVQRLGRALLHRGPDGEFDGFRVSAIRAGSLPEVIGFKNGDVVHAINGHAVNDISAAMNAYSSLMTEDEFAFDITRRGEPERIEVQVVSTGQ